MGLKRQNKRRRSRKNACCGCNFRPPAPQQRRSFLFVFKSQSWTLFIKPYIALTWVRFFFLFVLATKCTFVFAAFFGNFFSIWKTYLLVNLYMPKMLKEIKKCLILEIRDLELEILLQRLWFIVNHNLSNKISN